MNATTISLRVAAPGTRPRAGVVKRLAHACKLQRQTDLAVGEIAARVGLPDHAYFDRRFRQHFQTSPRATRSQWAERKGA